MALFFLGLFLLAPQAGAQAVSVVVPPNLILPNYNRVPIGQREGLEAGAFLARTDDAGANWYNPAGLAKSVKSALNASATAYEWTSMGLEGLGQHAGRSRLNTIGTLLAGVVGEGPVRSDHWRLGFSVTTPILWRPSSLDFAALLSNGQELFAYSTDVDFEVTVPGLAVAFAPAGVGLRGFRVGAGIGMAMTSLAQTQAISDRITTASTASVATRTFSADGSDWHLALSGGFQWDMTRGLTVAGRLFAPAVRVQGTSRLTSQGSVFTGSQFGDLIFQDTVARFDYQLPVEGDVGVSARLGQGTAEFDVRYYSARDDYEMYASPNLGRLTGATGNGSPSVTRPPFAPTMNSARSVVNVAVGGNFALSQRFRVHAGFSTDKSPVADQSTSLFRQVSLSRLTTGFSLTTSSLSGSLGLGYSFGSGTRMTIDPSPTGQSFETQLSVKTVNLLFAISYSFSSR